jgi:cytochrome bd-type quinol oxidase subunit 1
MDPLDGVALARIQFGLNIASAWRLLQAAEDIAAKKTLRAGIWIAAVLVPLQILIGDLHGLNTLEHQPAKIAAIEAIWKTEKGVPLVTGRYSAPRIMPWARGKPTSSNPTPSTSQV